MVALVYPHQLYANHPLLDRASEVWLVEDPLFFRQYRFHRQKLILHRASMAEFGDSVRASGRPVRIVEVGELNSTEAIGDLLAREGFTHTGLLDPSDDWLSKRVVRGCANSGIRLEVKQDPNFLTDEEKAEEWLGDKKRFFFTDFYIRQRKELGLLLEPDGLPEGGKWTFDTENRKRLPHSIDVPTLAIPSTRASVREATAYVDAHFPHALGDRQAPFAYPVTREEAQLWLHDFLEHRLNDFGDYEDAVSRSHATLFHSVLTPALNVGLLTPLEVVQAVLERRDRVPMNSLEGFVRQVIGWREFIRQLYRRIGVRQRTSNVLGHRQAMPRALYEGSTGIPPVDETIKRLLQTGYCHHIERLMILGNFMNLIEIHPDAIYQWFMEFFIDAYDWVMVPNLYGMSLYADGGLMTTKPYICGSNYILKMSDYPKGEWCEVWDGLYWRFLHRHRERFRANPRMALAVKSLDKMGARLPRLLEVGDRFLDRIHRA